MRHLVTSTAVAPSDDVVFALRDDLVVVPSDDLMVAL